MPYTTWQIVGNLQSKWTTYQSDSRPAHHSLQSSLGSTGTCSDLDAQRKLTPAPSMSSMHLEHRGVYILVGSTTPIIEEKNNKN